MKRIAILLCGHLRTWSRCKNNFKSIFLKQWDGLQIDIFVSTYTRLKGYHPYIQNKNNVSDNELDTDNKEIISLLDFRPTDLNIDDQSDFEDEVKKKLEKGKYSVLYDVYCQYAKIEKCLDMANKYSKENNCEYDYVIKTRPDIKFPNDLNLPVIIDSLNKDNSLYVLECSTNVKPNDHVFLATPENLQKLLTKILSRSEVCADSIHTLILYHTEKSPKLYEINIEVGIVRENE